MDPKLLFIVDAPFWNSSSLGLLVCSDRHAPCFLRAIVKLSKTFITLLGF
jgi:hypothetical protein